MRGLLTLLLLTALCTGVRAQKTSFLDSVHQVIATTVDDSSKVEAYCELVKEYLELKDTLLSRQYLDTLRALVEKDNDPYLLGRYHYMEAQSKNKWRNWEASLGESDRALAYFEEINNLLQIANSHWLAGLANMRMNKREEAIRRYLLSLRYGREAGGDRVIFQSLNELGNTHRRSKNLAEAEAYYQDAIELCQGVGWEQEELSVMNNLAIVRKNQGRFVEARALYEQGLRLAERLPDSRETTSREGYMYTNLAQLANALDKPREAINYAKLGLERFAEYGSPRERGAVLLHLGTASGKLARYADSENYYRRAREAGSKYPGLVGAANQGLINVFKKVGPLDSVVYYLELAATRKAEAAEENRVEVIAEMEARFQSSEKQAEIDRLALEDELSQARITRQRSFLIGGLVVLALLGAFSYFLFRQRQRIIVQNTTIKQALREKETLLKEIHHRVKNNLQMVSSLLSLQGDFIEDDAALDAIEMGQQRVRSMAIIHQRLYLRDEVTTTVSAKDYLDQLIGELLSTLNVNGLDLKLDKELEDVELDIDRMIPLGLVANEVITNALKHAFTGRTSGRLTVRFQRRGEDIRLQIADDGIGADNATTNDESFGSLLIRTFAEQLEGTLLIDNADGTSVELVFPAEAPV